MVLQQPTKKDFERFQEKLYQAIRIRFRIRNLRMIELEKARYWPDIYEGLFKKKYVPTRRSIKDLWKTGLQKLSADSLARKELQQAGTRKKWSFRSTTFVGAFSLKKLDYERLAQLLRREEEYVKIIDSQIRLALDFTVAVEKNISTLAKGWNKQRMQQIIVSLRYILVHIEKTLVNTKQRMEKEDAFIRAHWSQMDSSSPLSSGFHWFAKNNKFSKYIGLLKKERKDDIELMKLLKTAEKLSLKRTVKEVGSIVVGFLVGGIVGALVGWLYLYNKYDDVLMDQYSRDYKNMKLGYTKPVLV